MRFRGTRAMMPGPRPRAGQAPRGLASALDFAPVLPTTVASGDGPRSGGGVILRARVHSHEVALRLVSIAALGLAYAGCRDPRRGRRQRAQGQSRVEVPRAGRLCDLRLSGGADSATPNYTKASTLQGYPEHLGSALHLRVTNVACPGRRRRAWSMRRGRATAARTPLRP